MDFSEKQNQTENQTTTQPRPPKPPYYVSITECFEYKPACCKPHLNLEVKTFKVSLFQNAGFLNCAV